MIFARQISNGLTSLVKKIDAATVQHADCDMGSFVVFCGDVDDLEKDLKALDKKEKFKSVVLAIDNPSGPQDYNVAQDAEVTVVLYTKGKVMANHAFKKGELKSADVEKIVKDIDLIVPKK